MIRNMFVFPKTIAVLASDEPERKRKVHTAEQEDVELTRRALSGKTQNSGYH